MTKEQVYAAKEMYNQQIRNNATRLGINPEDYCSSIALVTSIMKKTKVGKNGSIWAENHNLV